MLKSEANIDFAVLITISGSGKHPYVSLCTPGVNRGSSAQSVVWPSSSLHHVWLKYERLHSFLPISV